MDESKDSPATNEHLRVCVAVCCSGWCSVSQCAADEEREDLRVRFSTVSRHCTAIPRNTLPHVYIACQEAKCTSCTISPWEKTSSGFAGDQVLKSWFKSNKVQAKNLQF